MRNPPVPARRPPPRASVRCAAFATFLVVLLGAPPLVSALASDTHAPQGWLLAALAQAATMIVFALSYNLLLGETGLLSFGHAAPAGLGALVAAQCFNHYPVALPLLPFVGGLGGAVFGALTALVAARRAGTAFAMITLGLGELVAAAAWALPDWFGGEAGVAIDRASGPPLGGWTFGPDREAYGVIAAWCVLAGVALFALTRTPFMRLVNAVRDNPVRAAALGCSPARVRAAMLVGSGFFAGVAGTLALINVELAASESVGIARSGAVLIATVTGGAASFLGPVLGALVWVAFSVGIASVTRAWMLYVGLFFVVVVLAAPDGLAGLALRQRELLARHGWRRCATLWAWAALAVAAALGALVPAVQWAYAVRFGDSYGDAGAGFAAMTSGAAGVLSAVIVGCGVVAAFAVRRVVLVMRVLEATEGSQ
ncbi:branched-chain amino acid ABC transporter permease [Paraburkholderia caballeronis]|uniref:branched-chain amino acid ABC transporter permease n=1 Tax=Paraburkholderia caballeronis TaxID=416943 RepID=UPI0010658ADD|nr:branched-chain amino acid ABC transporter permease [Paraburkholderia caballeronis]TDV04617.1 amino acid/amide ABC transporter membrane protein 2 (HAAT family) [Paraburkholderia caballeronis]TDV07760.1 amino acid/amide ABC transporter membrane protein 2 (HAAT family) [Paraburkholderia caballeronis]TDV18151.1 amino acid/amide ABC transporter membrane protein 2 (HAAT family) [Paraburkholderia caballeronis]